MSRSRSTPPPPSPQSGIRGNAVASEYKVSLRKQQEKYKKHTLAISKLNNLFHPVSETIGDKDVEKYINDLMNVNQSNDGETILYKACKYLNNKSAYAVKLLLEKNADPNIEDKYGNTPLIVATNQTKYKHSIVNEIVNELIKPEYDVDIGKTNKYNKNALYYACLYNMNDVALKLLNSEKSNPCVNGETLFHACENRMEDVAIRLIELCPELTNTILYNKSVYDVAKDKGLERVLAYLDNFSHIIRSIQKETGNPFYDLEGALMLKDFLDDQRHAERKALRDAESKALRNRGGGTKKKQTKRHKTRRSGK
jgi:ankyrin repeat protein